MMWQLHKIKAEKIAQVELGKNLSKSKIRVNMDQ